MRDSIEFIVLTVLLVTGQFAVDERRRSVREAARTVGMWAAFFGAITVLMFFPTAVAWLLRVLAALAGYWIARWIADWVVDRVRGPSMLARVKPKQAVEIAREVLLDGHAAPAEARRVFGRLKPLVRQHGDAVFLRAVLQVWSDSERPGDASAQAAILADQVETAATDVDELCADIARGSRVKIGRWDRRLAAEALLLFDADSASRLLRRDKAPLGSRAARKATILLLSQEARPAPWQDLLTQVGVYHPPEEPAKTREHKPAAPSGSRLLLSLALPPTGFMAVGKPRRAAVLAGTLAALLAYALYALSAGRTVGWIFLATWGLVYIMAVFAAYDLSRDL